MKWKEIGIVVAAVLGGIVILGTLLMVAMNWKIKNEKKILKQEAKQLVQPAVKSYKKARLKLKRAKAKWRRFKSSRFRIQRKDGSTTVQWTLKFRTKVKGRKKPPLR